MLKIHVLLLQLLNKTANGALHDTVYQFHPGILYFPSVTQFLRTHIDSNFSDAYKQSMTFPEQTLFILTDTQQHCDDIYCSTELHPDQKKNMKDTD
jgi:hypothetical protein